jgi:dTDP-4-amino-4,6-dideoxygalactose transaminase
VQIKPEAKINRDDFIQKMADAGIGCGVHYIPLHLHPYWRDTYQLKPEQFPHAHTLYQGTVSLPLYTKMTDEEHTRVIKTIRTILG